MAAPKIKWNRNAFRELRSSPEVRAELERRAAAIARASGDGFEYDSGITGGRGRARASVWTSSSSARRRNARENTLLRNLDRGRG